MTYSEDLSPGRGSEENIEPAPKTLANFTQFLQDEIEKRAKKWIAEGNDLVWIDEKGARHIIDPGLSPDAQIRELFHIVNHSHEFVYAIIESSFPWK